MEPIERPLTWVEIDLSAIEANARALIRHASGANLMAVVKANAYGHGAVEAAQAALRGGASWLGVARASEAIQLREAGIAASMLVLSPAPPARLGELLTQTVSLSVGDLDQLEQVAAAARAAARPARLHLKIDTGMSRLGASFDQLGALADRLAADEHLSFEGLFTHFARADESVREPVDVQLARFHGAIAALAARGANPKLIHAANSAATLTRPEAHFNLVRCGIALYGLQPSEQCPLPSGFKPALQWKAQLVRVRALPPGSGVSYGHEYVTRSIERIGTMPVGYADGLRRLDGNQVLIRGTLVPVVGRVCMDLSMLQLDGAAEAQSGDEVVLIGQQADQQITAEQVARRWGTINYEVSCAIGARVPRIYG